MAAALFSRCPYGISVDLPFQVVDSMRMLVSLGSTEHPLAAVQAKRAAPRSLAARLKAVRGLPPPEADAAPELTAARAAMLTLSSDLVEQQLAVVRDLCGRAPDALGIVRAVLRVEDAELLLGWLNRTFVRVRLEDVSDPRLGGEQSTWSLLDLEADSGAGEPPMSVLPAVFGQLLRELLVALG